MARVEIDLQEAARVIPMQTMFSRKVVDVPSTRSARTGLLVVKPATNNSKLSGTSADGRFTKGPWRGMPLYSLTLEERATCPSTCDQLVRCYGNRAHNATRYKHGPALEAALACDMRVLEAMHPEGFVMRLHVLGDFYAVNYVEHWGRLVRQHPTLHVYGYTHREAGTAIGDAVTRLVSMSEGRVRVLRSNGVGADDPLPRAIVVAKDATAAHPMTDVICPEQTGKSASCLTCGLCMNGRTNVTFLDHGTTPHALIALGRAQRSVA